MMSPLKTLHLVIESDPARYQAPGLRPGPKLVPLPKGVEAERA